MTDYIFSWDRMLSFQGNTAPYLQNAYVRIRSIFRKAGEKFVPPNELILTEPAELTLAKRLAQFAETVPQVLNDFRPNLLANYLFELANAFHAFYEACPVLKADEPARATRLALCELTGPRSLSRPGSLGNPGAREDVAFGAYRARVSAIPVQRPESSLSSLCREQAATLAFPLRLTGFNSTANSPLPRRANSCPTSTRSGSATVYASPYFQARAESLHGYEITDHNKLNDAIGSREDYDAWVAELHAHGMGQMLDFVPNHMGIREPQNLWWTDVLENGPSSAYAPYFDIDWQPLKADLRDKVLLPILGDQYGRVLERGELQVHFESGRSSCATSSMNFRLRRELTGTFSRSHSRNWPSTRRKISTPNCRASSPRWNICPGAPRPIQSA